jgi:hypothetical protein
MSGKYTGSTFKGERQVRDAIDRMQRDIAQSNYLSYVNETPGIWTPGYYNVPVKYGIIFTAENGNFISFESGGSVHPHSFWCATPGFAEFIGLGHTSVNGRKSIEADTAVEFTSGAPFVGNNVMFHAGANKAAHQANSSAATVAALVTDFNALLAKLQAAGLMA